MIISYIFLFCNNILFYFSIVQLFYILYFSIVLFLQFIYILQYYIVLYIEMRLNSMAPEICYHKSSRRAAPNSHIYSNILYFPLCYFYISMYFLFLYCCIYFIVFYFALFYCFIYYNVLYFPFPKCQQYIFIPICYYFIFSNGLLCYFYKNNLSSSRAKTHNLQVMG